jgi:hypothetical protein
MGKWPLVPLVPLITQGGTEGMEIEKVNTQYWRKGIGPRSGESSYVGDHLLARAAPGAEEDRGWWPGCQGAEWGTWDKWRKLSGCGSLLGHDCYYGRSEAILN